MEVFKTEREEISASEVPANIREQIEGEISKKIKNWYRYANEYFYGLNGEREDKERAKKFYILAAKAGHGESKKILKNFYKIELSASGVPVAIYEEKKLPATEDYNKAQNYFYGLNGFPQNRNQAKNFYAKAARAGNSEARKKLQDLIYLEKNYGF